MLKTVCGIVAAVDRSRVLGVTGSMELRPVSVSLDLLLRTSTVAVVGVGRLLLRVDLKVEISGPAWVLVSLLMTNLLLR